MRHLVPCRDGVFFDCEIRDKGFYKFGSITITEISETEVKTQFLEGRSEQNFDKTFDKVYINELDLGTPATTYKSGITPANVGTPRTQAASAWPCRGSTTIGAIFRTRRSISSIMQCRKSRITSGARTPPACRGSRETV